MATIQESVKQAKEAAAKMAEESSGGEVIEARANAAGQVIPFAKPSMATVAAATGIIPRSVPYLKVNEFGIRIGKNKTFITDPFKAKILMAEDKGFQVKHTLRFGNPATYISTYDGMVADKGGSWQDAIMKAQMANPGVEPYPSVDVVMTAEQKVGDVDKGGQIAWNSSKTNFSEWSDFYQAVAEADALGEEVTAQVHFRAIEHNGNEWGVVTFELL